MKKTILLCIVYIAAIAIANVSVAVFGPPVILLNAFLWIGLDLTTRDVLHDRWRQTGHLWRNMFVLILLGGLVSWMVYADAGWIAVASTLAFLSAGTADLIVYHYLGNQSRRLRVNGSNVVSATVDSIVFPTVAFGALMPEIVMGQIVVKIFGGFLWGELFSALSFWRMGRRDIQQPIDAQYTQ